MASKKKGPEEMFDDLIYALSDSYQERNEGRTFDDALVDLQTAFEEVLSFLPDSE